MVPDYAPPPHPPPRPIHTFPTPSDLLADLAAPSRLPPPPSKKVETQRNARRRAVAESIGFLPTDPDTISSHDKKRHYLECLEEFVSYLHQQLLCVGQQPPPLTRTSNYDGLQNRSLRTLLIHMQDNVRDLQNRTLVNEQHFLALQREAIAQEDAAWQDVPPQPLQMGYPLPVSPYQYQ